MKAEYLHSERSQRNAVRFRYPASATYPAEIQAHIERIYRRLRMFCDSEACGTLLGDRAGVATVEIKNEKRDAALLLKILFSVRCGTKTVYACALCELWEEEKYLKEVKYL